MKVEDFCKCNSGLDNHRVYPIEGNECMHCNKNIMKEQIIELPIFGIEVYIDGDGGGSIVSTDLKTKLQDEEDELYNAAMDGIESMILAHACAGVDITTPQYLEGIETAVDGCANNY